MRKSSRYSHEFRGPSAKAFTVFELMIAVGITALMAGLLIGITAQVMDIWNRSRGSLSNWNQARLTLDQLQSDLEGLILRCDGNVWFVTSISGAQPAIGGDADLGDARYNSRQSKPASSSVSLRLNPSGNAVIPPIEELRFGHVGVWLRFFTYEVDSNERLGQMSGPRAVSYQIARIPDISDGAAITRRYFLFRSTARAAPLDSSDEPAPSTFGAGYDLLDSAIYRNAGAFDASNGTPDSIRRPDRTAIIASDVIDFGIRVFVADPTGRMVEQFPVDRSNPADTTPPQRWAFVAYHGPGAPIPPNPPYGMDDADVAFGMPSEVEIMVRVLTEEGASMLRGLENPTAGYVPGGLSQAAFGIRWWEIAMAHSEVFTRRIKVRVHSL